MQRVLHQRPKGAKARGRNMHCPAMPALRGHASPEFGRVFGLFYPERASMRAITAWLCIFGKLLPGCRGGPSEGNPAAPSGSGKDGYPTLNVRRRGLLSSAEAGASAAASSPRAGCPGSARKSALKSGPALRRPGHSWPVDRPRRTLAEHPADRGRPAAPPQLCATTIGGIV